MAVAPAGSSQSPGTSNGWSSRISNQRARNRPDRAEHHCSRQGSQGSVPAAFLGQCSHRNKRQRYHRCNNKPFHVCFPETPRCSGYDRIAAVRRRPLLSFRARTSDSSDGGYTGQVLVARKSKAKSGTIPAQPASVYFCPEQDGDRGDLTRIALRFIRVTTLSFPCDIPLTSGPEAPFRIDI